MVDKFDGVFTINNISSEERYDLAKFMEFMNDDFEVICSPFLHGFKALPLWRYYKCIEGYKEIDQISYDVYGTLFYAPLLQIYNDTLDEVFNENTVLKLFRIEDLEELYSKIANTELDKLG